MIVSIKRALPIELPALFMRERRGLSLGLLGHFGRGLGSKKNMVWVIEDISSNDVVNVNRGWGVMV